MYITTLVINGMKCGMCECYINDLVRKSIKTIKVKTSYKKRQCIFTHIERMDIDYLIACIQNKGYHVESANTIIKGVNHD